jgi:hypothetical protein
VAEVIVYSGDNTAGTTNQRIESYLALKYGISIDQTVETDYLASDGTTKMWNSASDVTEVTYINDIFGIGRDDASGLMQLKSKSQQQNGYGIITLSPTTGALPSDLSFMTIADNGGSASFVSAQAPSGYRILGKRWQVQEPAADVGNVTLQIDVNDTQFNVANASNFFLMIDTDSDGTYFDETVAGGGLIALYDNATNGDVTANDNIWSVNNIDFPTSDVNKESRFTIGTRVQGPGGVTTDLVMWLNASDVDADGVTTDNPADGANMNTNISNSITPAGTYWVDRSAGANHITSTNSGFLYESDATNLALFGGNPSVRGVNGFMNIASPGGLKSGTTYLMYQMTSSNTNLDSIISSPSADIGLEQYLYVSAPYVGQYMGLATNQSSNGNYDNCGGGCTQDNNQGGTVVTTYTNEPAIAMWDRPTDGDELMIAEYQRTKINTPTRVQNVFGVSGNSMMPFGYYGAIGNNRYGGQYASTINITFGEIITYGCTTTGCVAGKSSIEKEKIESYLAMKYGTTMRTTAGAAQDYKDSGYTTVWSASTANLHTNRIAFIGQDDASAWRKTASAIIEFSNNEILKVQNPSDLEDREFASIADDNGQITNAISSNSPASFQQRLARTWKWQTVGGDGVGTVDLRFDLNKQSALPTGGTPTSYKIMFDADGDFTSGATISNIVPTVSAGVVTFAGIAQASLANGTYIAIGQPGASLTYSALTWTETSANAGAIDQTVPVTVTLTGDTFPAAVVNGTNLTSGVHYSLVNLPAGLTFNLRKDSDTQLTAIITGTASPHLNAQDVANFGITFTAAAFTSSALPEYVVDYNKSDLGFDFADPNGALIEFSSASAASTNEATANNFPTLLINGTLTSSQSVDIIVSGGTATPYGVDYTHGTLNVLTVTIPAGTYDGTAATDIVLTSPILNNDIAGEGGETIILGLANLTSALTIGDANVNATTQSAHTYTITDDERSITYAASTVTEVGANDGSFTSTLGFTLSGDTFASVGVQALTTKYTVANIPSGLTVVVTTTSPTAGNISFTGNAAAHANINDVTNGTVIFTNAAFTGGSAATVVGYNKTNI